MLRGGENSSHRIILITLIFVNLMGICEDNSGAVYDVVLKVKETNYLLATGVCSDLTGLALLLMLCTSMYVAENV